jgi:predicted alpha/beta hydrolase
VSDQTPARRGRSSRSSRARSASGSAKRGSREIHAPRASFEELEIRTEDGVALRAVVDDPPQGVALRGTCVLAHALVARKTEFGRRDRAGLAQAYAARGWRTIAFDFRGHGESTLPSGITDWGYDDLVRLDFPAVVECARAHGDGLPVIVAGHSLGAHVALAAQGTGRIAADAIVSIAGSVWLPALETSRLRWAAKATIAHATLAAVSRFGVLPARKLRLGSDDAPPRAVRELFRGATSDGRWRSTDGRDDYLASLANVVVPVCSVASDGDRVTCTPRAAAALVLRCGGPVELVVVRRSDDGRRPPGHMELVTTDRARSKLVAALAWIESKV